MKCYSYDGEFVREVSDAPFVSMTTVAMDILSNSDWYQFKIETKTL